MLKSKRDHNYLNISINPSSPIGNSLARYEESFNRPIASDLEDLYFAITRFSVPTSEIPLFYFPLNINQADRLVSNLIIGIKTVGLVNYSQTVNFILQNNSPLPPASASYTAQQALSKCYEIFSVNAFIMMINTALQAAVTASGIGGVAPYYTYNPTTELKSLVLNAGFVATGAVIYMNESLENYLAGFQFFQSDVGAVDEYQHVFNPLPPTTYLFSEDYRCMSLWFDIRKIVLVSDSLPVLQETSPTQDAITGLSEGIINYTPILTDFIVSFDSPSQFLGFADYTPDTYRLVDMIKSSIPITRLHLQFYWLNKQGTRIPLEISNTQAATLKLAFLQKSLYNNEY